MPALPNASVLKPPRNMLLVSMFICGISMASVMGSAIDSICLLVTVTFKFFVVAVLSIKSAKISYFAAEMQHVNPSFNIQQPGINFETARLFAEAGPMGISITVLDSNNCFVAVIEYAFSPGLTVQDLAEKFTGIFKTEKLLQQKFSKTYMYWSFAQSILVPAELMNDDRNANMLNLVFGDSKKGIIHSDFLFKHNLHNVYRIPENVIDVFSVYLPVAIQTHFFSAMVNRDIPAGNNLYTVFYSNSLTIMLCKDAKLQVIQNFDFINPDDCIFHLLNVCKGFEVAADSVNLHISGMIDMGSGLFSAVNKYFLHTTFDELPEGFEYTAAIQELPSHFFSSLFYLASCV